MGSRNNNHDHVDIYMNGEQIRHFGGTHSQCHKLLNSYSCIRSVNDFVNIHHKFTPEELCKLDRLTIDVAYNSIIVLTVIIHYSTEISDIKVKFYNDCKEKEQSYEVEIDPDSKISKLLKNMNMYSLNPYDITGYGSTQEEAFNDFRLKISALHCELQKFIRSIS